MSKGLRLLAFLFAFLGMISFSLNNAQAASFSDVSNHWAQKEIEFLYNKGVISGYGDGSKAVFNPENTVTRAQAAKMIVLAKGKKEVKVTRASFGDVSTGHWASGWVESAIKEGYFNGYEKENKFYPDRVLTRAQMSKVIAHAFNMNAEAASSKPAPFADSKTSWAASYIKTLYYAGVTTGSNGQFKPETNINRGQFATFLSRALSEQFRVTPKPVEEAPTAPAKPAPTPTPEPAPTTYMATGKATVSALNMRSQANSSSTILARLNRGDQVKVYSISGYWAKVNFNGKVGYIHKTYLKLKSTSTSPLKDRLIVVDAGHGGKDPGAVKNGAQEKIVALEVAKRVQTKLQNDGAKVLMTRVSDTYPTLSDRVNFAKSHYGELFISIHFNAAGSSAAKGAETFYNSDNVNSVESKELAVEIQKQLVSMTNMYDRGVKDGNFHVIREQSMPSVLVELGFITNADDYKKLTSPYYWNLYAEAVYRGTKAYYSR
ncbi:N-acetylmuramoyl-L-alanine amidase [Bacillus ectoiniformans]|uniref:N-acetylmuramoyl-L-alanine amidase n=1 Tax=Bacillus ectoiniformans TaxID=1494429 RepID=UPI001956A059|nr:N-acetylmuramoyl-L-alanine amidase [Bacillus ectoiniformans]MBM7649333.1 N-acetylmuramoyl-L-alanine amidase [Bacillus ectoiniformans]